MSDAFMPQSLDGDINSAGWTSIAPTADWDHVLVSNLNGADVLRLRRVSGDATTEIAIAVGAQQPLVLNPPRENTYAGSSQVNWRFPAGVIAFYLKTDSGTGSGMSLIWG
jgi:hypothetical protein